ncbi:MAG: cytochrome c oxidase subunit II [Candidatus Planktophila sp.]|nr:cytochrome c oxidase subunit II [Candidatus Planktophila sp.]
MTPKAPQWWKKPDVKKTAILWVVCTAVIGYVGAEFHVRNMVSPASETMSGVISLMRVFTWAAAPVAGLVAAMCLTVLTSKRHYGDNPPAEADHQVSNSPRATALWIVVSALLCLFALVGGFIVIQKDSSSLFDKSALQVNVTGQQWLWNFDYENGARSEDLYLPVNKPVVFHITSVDVKHSFWVVQMGIKMDANPGYTTEAAVTPNKIGVFDVRCTELCGLLHAYMQTKVHVVSQADYDAWLSIHVQIEKGA